MTSGEDVGRGAHGDILRVVIVGAALAGVRTAQALRRQGYTGVLTLVGAEAHLPYDRPPLSKRYLAGDLEVHELTVYGEDVIAALDVELMLGTAVTGLDLGARRIVLADGRSLLFDRLVVATGAEPVLPPMFRGRPGLTGFRTLEDATLLRERLAAGTRVVVVGAGFIGAEIASTVRQMGHEIALVEALDQPMERVLGAEIGSVLAGLHVARGVRLYTGSAVVEVLGTDRVDGLLLADGRQLAADHVVVSVGVRPNTDWLAGNGLDLNDGVRCDNRGAAIGSDGLVYAVGDVAAWHHERYGANIRVEHWTSAVEMAPLATRSLLGIDTTDSVTGSPPLALPYFWSDQCGTKIQLIGRVEPGDSVEIIKGSTASGRFLALYRRGDRATAALSFGMARDLMALRGGLEAGLPWRELVASVDSAHPADPVAAPMRRGSAPVPEANIDSLESERLARSRTGWVDILLAQVGSVEPPTQSE